MFKLDDIGRGVEIQLADLHKSRGMEPFYFTPEALLDLSVFTGCDYLVGIPGIGMRKASQFLHLSNGDIARAIELAQAKGFAVPVGFHHSFLVARLVFRSQVVFDVATRQTQPLRPVSDDWNRRRDSILGLGRNLPHDVASAIADGQLHPETLEPFSCSPAQDNHQRSVLPDKVPESRSDTGTHSEGLNTSDATYWNLARREENEWLCQLGDVFGQRLAQELARVIAKNDFVNCPSEPTKQQSCYRKEAKDPISFQWPQIRKECAFPNSRNAEPRMESPTSSEQQIGNCALVSKQFRPPRLQNENVVERSAGWPNSGSWSRHMLGEFIIGSQSYLSCGTTYAIPASLDCGRGSSTRVRTHVKSSGTLALDPDLTGVLNVLCTRETTLQGTNAEAEIATENLSSVASTAAMGNWDRDSKERLETQRFSTQDTAQEVNKQKEESQLCELQEDGLNWRVTVWSEWQRTSFQGEQRALWQCSEPVQYSALPQKRQRLASQ